MYDFQSDNKNLCDAYGPELASYIIKRGSELQDRGSPDKQTSDRQQREP